MRIANLLYMILKRKRKSGNEGKVVEMKARQGS